MIELGNMQVIGDLGENSLDRATVIRLEGQVFCCVGNTLNRNKVSILCTSEQCFSKCISLDVNISKLSCLRLIN